MIKNNKCIICDENANAKNSHIVPMNLIKDCIGERNNEVSYNINIENSVVNKEIYIGNALKHKSEDINCNDLKTIDLNPYTLDYILCNTCEERLGKIESKVYSEIILKIRDLKFKNNFINTNISKFDVIIPNTKKITKVELDIYFYSIILRYIKLLLIKEIKINIDSKTIKSISNYIFSKLYETSNNEISLSTGLIVYVTNNPKKHVTLLKTNLFHKLIIPVCHFFIVLECNNFNTPFGNCMNLTKDTEFKFIKNTEELDYYLSAI